MYIIKHGVRNTLGDVLWDEPLPLQFETIEDCKLTISSLIERYDHSDFEQENDRWCTWNDSKQNEFHYWWIVAVAPLS